LLPIPYSAFRKKKPALSGFLVLTIFTSMLAAQARASTGKISLDQAVLIALQNDLTLANYRDESLAMRSAADAESTLPAPLLGFKLANVPVDSFEFNQEPMTQAVISYAQKLPAKGMLKSRKNTLLRSAEILIAKETLRAIELRKQFELAWVNAWKAQEIVEITKRHREHFEQMIASAEANYRAALRRTSQRDVLTLNTALAQLDNRTQAAQTQLIVARESLREWFDSEQLQQLNFASATALKSSNHHSQLSSFEQHPAIAVQEQKIQRADAAIALATAMGRSGKSVNVSYGYREDAENGSSRSDFLSIGFSMELSSLRSEANRSRSEEARVRREQAARDKQLALLRLRSEYLSTIEINQSLDTQLQLIEKRLLPQSVQQADSARGAYASGEAAFMEVQRAQINLMQVELQEVDAQAQTLKNAVNINYLTARTSAQPEPQQ